MYHSYIWQMRASRLRRIRHDDISLLDSISRGRVRTDSKRINLVLHGTVPIKVTFFALR